jgi:N-sulfoglucosamine sulfohydrolase
MKPLLIQLTFLFLALPGGMRAAEPTAPRPNILFIIADDASRHYGQAYGCDWVKTPHIDRLAKAGLVFDNAYTPTSKCAPSRSAILTGRNPWQLEDAANHQPNFPAKFMAFSEALVKAGIACGAAGKVWGPGDAKHADGSPRDFALPKVKGNRSPGAGFTTFLKSRKPKQPFFYWFGSNNPHRAYKRDSGIAAGKKTSGIDRIPAYWPDDDIVRRDMLDYAIEVEAFDAQVGSLLEALEASGEAKNTLIIITSDNGMPFPRVKGHTYDDANRMPFVVSWPAGIAQPGRRVTELISFIDLAPTFLDLLGIDGIALGMSPITGRSFTDLLKNSPEHDREFVLIGRERNDVLIRPATPSAPSGLGYPVRAIRQGDFLFIRNFAPDRWPCGNPELDLRDTDRSPTKSMIVERGEKDPFWQHAFGKRPAEQLFNLSLDPDCVTNLADHPDHLARTTALRDKLMAELKRQQDPRAFDQGDIFDQYISPNMEKAMERIKKNPQRK